MKYNKKRAIIICESLMKLESKIKACQSAGITPKTYYEWYNTKPEFKDMVDRAIDYSYEVTKHDAISAIKSQFSKNWTSAAWWLERTCPDEFGRKDKIDNNVNINQVRITYVSPEQELLPEHQQQENLPDSNLITIKIEDNNDENKTE